MNLIPHFLLLFQPTAFARIGPIVETMIVGKDVEKPNSILAFVSGDRVEQFEYIKGLAGIGIFLVAILFIWFLTLLVLKCFGRELMGCGAGYPFRNGRESQDTVFAAVDPNDSVAMDDPVSRLCSKKHSKFTSFSWFFPNKKKHKKRPLAKMTNKKKKKRRSSPEKRSRRAYIEESQYIQGLDLYLGYSIPKTVRLGDESSSSEYSYVSGDDAYSEQNLDETNLCSARPRDVERRKFNTRSVFATFALISLACCVLLVTHMFKPLETAALSTSDIIQETAQIIDEVNEVLEILDEATVATVQTVETTPLDYNALCPNFPIEDFERQFGFNPQTFIRSTSSVYQNYVPAIADLLSTAKQTGDSVTNMIRDIDDSVSTANEYLWIVPLVLCSTMLIIFSQLALMIAVAYREQKFKGIRTSTPKVEGCYRYTVLPLQILVVILSWLLMIVFFFGIVVTTDSCLPSFGSGDLDVGGRGSPEDVILAVVDQYITADTGVANAKERVTTYLTGCGGIESDPLAEVIVLQKVLQESVGEVDGQISFANDETGLAFMEQRCGSSNQVRIFFQNLAFLQTKYQNVDMAIKRGYDALSCPRVNALYIDAVHGAFCTDFATANSNGLMLLLLLSFSGMILITLRASWRTAE